MQLRWRWIRAAVGLSLTLMIIVLLARTVSFANTSKALVGMRVIWFGPLICLIALSELLRAAKWQAILAAIRRVGVMQLYSAIMIGSFVNVLIPIRVSPLIRAYLVRRKEHIPTVTVLGTVTVDRLSDGLVSVGLLAVVLLTLTLPPPLAAVRATLQLISLSLVCAYGLLVVILVLVRRDRKRGGRVWQFASRPFPRRWRAAMIHAGRHFVGGLIVPPRWQGRLLVIGLALLQKVLQATQLLVVAHAFGYSLSLASAMLLILFLGASVLAAGALGIQGGYYVASTVGLSWFGIPTDIGLAIGIASSIGSYSTVIALGLLFAFRDGLRIRDMRLLQELSDSTNQHRGR
ncbi:MAG: hypothetical protein NVS2B7_36090 [Herpetosiphon sp.]